MKKLISSIMFVVVIISITVVIGFFLGESYLNSNNVSVVESNTDNEMKEEAEEGVSTEPQEEIKSEEEIKDEAERKKELEDIKNDPFMVLVNSENKLDGSYVPENLVELDIKFKNFPDEKNLNGEAAQAAKEMFEAATADGLTLIGASGYRSYALQAEIYNTRVAQSGEEEASKYIASPGASEHQLGLALDIVSTEYQYLYEEFEQTKSFEWLMDNAYKYGFILRYLKGKEDITGYNYEPWHFRYIGNSEVAKYITENNLTFEEFHELLDKEIKF